MHTKLPILISTLHGPILGSCTHSFHAFSTNKNITCSGYNEDTFKYNRLFCSQPTNTVNTNPTSQPNPTTDNENESNLKRKKKKKPLSDNNNNISTSNSKTLEVIKPKNLQPLTKSPKGRSIDDDEDEYEGITILPGTPEVTKTEDGVEWEYFDVDPEEEKKKEKEGGSLYDLFLGEAKAGDIGAMHNVGKMLTEEGTRMNKGIEWLQRAVDGGHVGALTTLAQAYRSMGDDHKALLCFTEAYKKGNENAAWNIATLHMHGIDGEKDLEACFKWYMIAAEKGNADAMYNVGMFYLRGMGAVEVDQIYAKEWLTKAAAKGSEKAQKLIEQVQMAPRRMR